MAMLDSAAVSGDAKRSPTPGELVARQRNRKNLTQEELATRIGRSVNTINNLEKGRHKSRATVEAVAVALDTTPEALGFRFRKPLREMTSEQREIVDEILALPPELQAAARELLAKLRRGGK